MRADVKIVPTATPGVFAVSGYWTILAGTGAYANLHGVGTLTETAARIEEQRHRHRLSHGGF